MSQLHSLLTAVHRPYAAIYADATARLAATGFVRALGGGIVAFTSDDVYKVALQLDNATEWVLTAITPTWVQIGGNGLMPGAHATSHQNGGSDEISVAGLSGVLADPQTPATHASSHQNGGGDEISVAGLSGVLADPQVADKVKESSGPTTLTVGAVADGEYLRRSGSSVVSGVPAGTGAEPGANSDITSMDGLTGAIENPTKIVFPEAAAPSTPGANKVVLYAKSDGLLYSKDDAGAESAVSGGGGATINPTDNVLPRRSNSTTFADSFLTHDAGNSKTHTTGHFAVDQNTNRVLGFANSGSAIAFGGLAAAGVGAMKVVADAAGNPGTILSVFVAPAEPGGNPAPWSSVGMNFRRVLTGNISVGNPGQSGGNGTAIDGYRFILMLVQDGTGSRTATWGSDYNFPGGTTPTLTTAANSVDIFEFICYGDQAYCIGQFLDVK